MNSPTHNGFSRRGFLAAAAAIGAEPAWASGRPGRSRFSPSERRDLFPEGVASGDPSAHSVILWTRHPGIEGSRVRLRVEVAEDETFHRIVAVGRAVVSSASDWTCRVLVGNLKPACVYWYRFINTVGDASRTGRTITAPADDDPRPANFAFVSCHDATTAAQNAFRRMIFDDEHTPAVDRISFVLHLGDFYYEGITYPEDQPPGPNRRRVRDVVRYPDGEKIGDRHFPTSLNDYRAIFRAHLRDPDLQDARSRWPFVCIWDNGEFSWEGWQSLQILDASGRTRPAQTRKVAANQAWFEFQPARVNKSSGPSLASFEPPQVVDAPIEKFDAHGLGQEPNNLAALASLTGYRALRWGANVELIITDQRSYCSEPPLGRPEAQPLKNADYPRLLPQEALEALDAGRSFNNGKPMSVIRLGDAEISNFRKEAPPQTILGAEQKAWFLEKLKASQATWKIWGNSVGTLDGRADPQNLPPGLTKPWPGSGYACFQVGDFATAFMERAEIYEVVRASGITGFATVSGNSHAFYAGLAAPFLPPRAFEPVGVAFVTGSISAMGYIESAERTLPLIHPLRNLYLVQRSTSASPEPNANILLRHGVRSCLEYQRSGNLELAKNFANPDLAPHLSFVDLAGHGYAIVRASVDALECEFVCIPRPLERAATADGGPILYRIKHRTALWAAGESPQLQQRIVEGAPPLHV